MGEEIKMNRREKCIATVSVLAVFLTIYVFFTVVYPLVIFDGDDWCYIAQFRNPLPLWHNWNPARVFPETIMPVMGYIGAYVIYPLTGHYLASIAAVFSFGVALVTTVLYYVLSQCIRKQFNLSVIESYSIGLLFIALYFLFFKSQHSNNQYMFEANNLICYYYYTVPSLLNSIMVLVLMSHREKPNFYRDYSYLKQGFFFLAIYFSIFSNVFQSIIIATYCGWILVQYLWSNRSLSKAAIVTMCKAYSLYIGILAFWMIQILFEMNGGRAKYIGGSVGVLQLPLAETIHHFISLLKMTQIPSFAVCLLLIGASLFFAWKKKQESAAMAQVWQTAVLLLSSGLSCIFLILVSSKAGTGYAGNIQCMYSPFFFFLLAAVLSLAYVLSVMPKLKIIFPFLLMVVIVAATASGKSYHYPTVINRPSNQCEAVSQYLIDQIIAAEQNGQTNMVLKVPKGDDNDNWPHPTYMGRNISHALYSHGIISKKMKITIEPDSQLNDWFYK
jgi:hypothetical protein